MSATLPIAVLGVQNSSLSSGEPLTSHILQPDSPLQQEDVVRHHQEVHGLEYQEDMPRLDSISWVPERGQSQGHGRKSDDKSRRGGDPSEHIDSATPITLFPKSTIGQKLQNRHQPARLLTSPLLADSGASMLVQWYCPPAVGCTDAISAMLRAHAAPKMNIMMMP